MSRNWPIALLAGSAGAALAVPTVDRSTPSTVTNVTREQLETMPTATSVADLIKTCPARTIPTVTRPSGSTPTTPASGMNCIQPDDLRMIEIYKAHNEARYEVGSRPLVWDPLLAQQAASYGPELAQYGRPVHSSRIGRESSRENLLQALPGTSPAGMMGVWTGEKKNFVNGVFPDVSLTGNWADVGHYTQLVWPTTTNLGCAIHKGGQFDWLICRYSPPGNKDGKMVLAEREKEPPLPPTTSGGLIHPGGIPAPSGPSTAPHGVYQVSDHISVKADYDPSTCPPTTGKTPIVQASTPPPESILDDIGDEPSPPPESILDDVGEGSAGPPPESILDDVGQTQTATRESPPPPPKTEKGKAVHDTPMAQPQLPSVTPSCIDAARDVPDRCPDNPPPACKDEASCIINPAGLKLDPTRNRPTASDPAGLYTYRQAARNRFYDALKAGDSAAADVELLEMEYALEEMRKAGIDQYIRQFERQLQTDYLSRARGGCEPF